MCNSKLEMAIFSLKITISNLKIKEIYDFRKVMPGYEILFPINKDKYLNNSQCPSVIQEDCNLLVVTFGKSERNTYVCLHNHKDKNKMYKYKRLKNKTLQEHIISSYKMLDTQRLENNYSLQVTQEIASFKHNNQ